MNWLYRNLKNGELTLLNITLFLAIFSLTTILFFTEGVRNTLLDKTGLLLGGDRVISSPTPIDPLFITKAEFLNLKTAETIIFLSMLQHKDELSLAEVKGIDTLYPLKGNLQGSFKLFEAQHVFSDIPEPGTVWLETNLFTLLNANINDIIKIGDAQFRITRVLTFEPDRGGQGLAFAPRALINIQDVEKTKAIQPGSRQTYKLAVIGPSSALESFDTFVTPKLSPLQTYKIAGKEQPILDKVFTQTQFYLNIVLIINIVFASIAVSQTIRRFCLRQYKTVAILRCFGAAFHWIISRIALEILTVGLLFSVLGFGLGAAFFAVVKNYIETPLLIKIEMLWSIPTLAGLGCVLGLLLLFGLPPLLKLKNVAPLLVLRKNNAPPTELQSAGNETNFYRSLSTLVKLPIFFINTLLSPFPKLGVPFKYGIGNIYRYATQNIIQIIGFTLVMTGIFLLFFIHVDLLQSFRAQTPANAPNFFAINIDPEDVKKFATALNEVGIPSQTLYPLVRARLLSINNEAVAMDAVTPSASKTQTKRIPRLLNLSYVATLPAENEIVAGKFFVAEDQGTSVVSIEEGFADRMEIHLNDELTFLIAEKSITAKVTSIRRVNWDSFNPNFFVLFPPKVLDPFPKTYITSFHVENSQRTFLKTLVSRFPALNLIDITMVLSQATSLMHTISKGIAFLLMCSGLMAMFMLFACLYAGLDQRKHDALLFRILGASKNTLFTVLLTEFAIIGFCAGTLATLISYLLYLWLAASVFKIATVSAWHWLALGPIVGMMFISLVAWMMLRKVIRHSPKVLLTVRGAL